MPTTPAPINHHLTHVIKVLLDVLMYFNMLTFCENFLLTLRNSSIQIKDYLSHITVPHLCHVILGKIILRLTASSTYITSIRALAGKHLLRLYCCWQRPHFAGNGVVQPVRKCPLPQSKVEGLKTREGREWNDRGVEMIYCMFEHISRLPCMVIMDNKFLGAGELENRLLSFHGLHDPCELSRLMQPHPLRLYAPPHTITLPSPYRISAMGYSLPSC